MSETNHTPGPWRVSIGDNYGITAEAYPKEFPHHYKSDDLGGFLAYVGNRAEDFGEANAQLIAAAPELLAALEEIVARNEIQHWFNLDQARAAIAKAKGEK